MSPAPTSISAHARRQDSACHVVRKPAECHCGTTRDEYHVFRFCPRRFSARPKEPHHLCFMPTEFLHSWSFRATRFSLFGDHPMKLMFCPCATSINSVTLTHPCFPITARSSHFRCLEFRWIVRALDIRQIFFNKRLAGCEIFHGISLNAAACCGTVCATVEWIAARRLEVG